MSTQTRTLLRCGGIIVQKRDGSGPGIALFPEHVRDADELRRLADAAMYGVKEAERGGYGFVGEAPSS